MPSPNFKIREGRNSPIITAHMAAIVTTVLSRASARSAAADLGLGSRTVTSFIRTIEAKAKCRLFMRARGRGNDEWKVCDSAEARHFMSWLQENKHGGIYKPEVQGGQQ